MGHYKKLLACVKGTDAGHFQRTSKLMRSYFCQLFIASCLLSSCSVSKQIYKQAGNILLKDSAIRKGHIGISIYEPATGKYWYEHNADKFFVPASNTKLFTLYAGMKYLGDSLVGLRYAEKGASITIFPAADPTFLLPEYKKQFVFEFLKTKNNISYCSQLFSDNLGNGWAWNDYKEPYMAQSSEMPIYGNLIRVYGNTDGFSIVPGNILLHNPAKNNTNNFGFQIALHREWNKNEVFLSVDSSRVSGQSTYEITLVPGIYEVPEFLADTLKKKINFVPNKKVDSIDNNDIRLNKIHSQPSDSLFKPMMHRSDNFFAEQTLLMASNEKLGYMSDKEIIDTVLKTHLKGIPQKPKWVDGSGLSRYNLFTPQSFIYLLNKMKKEFDWERIKNILPTGGEGTLSNYYKTEAGFIFAKTGTLSNNCALSGYLITKKNKLLIFSVLANNYQTGATPVRRAVEKFIKNIREKY